MHLSCAFKIILYKDYRYFGLQNGDGCYCGNDDSKLVPVSPDECDQPCSGDSNEICGASWRLSVYGPNQIVNVSAATTASSNEIPVETTTDSELDPQDTTTGAVTTVSQEFSTSYRKTCQFNADGNGAIFDTGSLYGNHMRKGYEQKLHQSFSKAFYV